MDKPEEKIPFEIVQRLVEYCKLIQKINESHRVLMCKIKDELRKENNG